jgi:hypothetical protein
MNATFHLIDLVSQVTAVQSLLCGRSAEEKIEWLSSHGSITPKPKTRPDERQCFWFESPTRATCCFFLDGDEFVFIGDHTTFTASDSR